MSEMAGRDLFPPGEYIRDELAAREWTQEDLAAILDRPLKTVNQIIQGKKAITPKSAHELAAAFGTSAELWMNLEAAYRLGQESVDRRAVEHRAKLYDAGPVGELLRRRWIPQSESSQALEDSLCGFWEVSSLDESFSLNLAARWGGSNENATLAQCAWVQRVRQLAAAAPAKRYDRARAVALLDELHALTAAAEEARRVPAVLAEMGIRFVVCEHLSGTRIDGVATWLDEWQPVIGMSVRHDRIDGFWHTLAHELRHILNGDATSLDIDLIGKNRIGASVDADAERRADDEASDFLVPSSKLEPFITRNRPRFSKTKIIQFANFHQIHPGIVVGQLQHRGAIQYSHSREMLVPVRASVTSAALTDGWGILPGI